MSGQFPKPKSLGANVKVELYLSHYVTKADLKNATGVDTSKFAKEVDLTSFQFDVLKLDIDKLKNVPRNSRYFKSNLDKWDIEKLETTPVDLSKLTNIVKIDVVKKTEYDELVKNFNAIQTTDNSNWVKKTYCNTEKNEMEKKNTDYDHDKYITTQEVNKIMSKSFAARWAQANLASKNDNVALVKKTDFYDKLKNLNKKGTRNKAKHVDA